MIFLPTLVVIFCYFIELFIQSFIFAFRTWYFNYRWIRKYDISSLGKKNKIFVFVSCFVVIFLFLFFTSFVRFVRLICLFFHRNTRLLFSFYGFFFFFLPFFLFLLNENLVQRFSENIKTFCVFLLCIFSLFRFDHNLEKMRLFQLCIKLLFSFSLKMSPFIVFIKIQSISKKYSRFLFHRKTPVSHLSLCIFLQLFYKYESSSFFSASERKRRKKKLKKKKKKKTARRWYLQRKFISTS